MTRVALLAMAALTAVVGCKRAPGERAETATPANTAAESVPVASASATSSSAASDLARQLEALEMDALAATPATSAEPVKPALPRGSVTMTPAQVTSGSLTRADLTLAMMQRGLRNCYVRGLQQEDPSQQGEIAFSVRIESDGNPSQVSASASGTISAGVIACARARVTATQFDPPGQSAGAALSFRAILTTP